MFNPRQKKATRDASDVLYDGSGRTARVDAAGGSTLDLRQGRISTPGRWPVAVLGSARCCQAPSMNQAAAERSAKRVGIITLAIGIGLVLAPSRTGQLLRTGHHPVALRVIGASDLVLVPALLRGRRPFRWMAVRVGLNLAIGAYWLSVARREGAVGAKIAAASMVAAIVADGRTITTLRRPIDQRGFDPLRR